MSKETETKKVTVTVKIDPVEAEVFVGKTTMNGLIDSVMKQICKHPADYLVVNVKYTNAGMLKDLRKCHARGIGCPADGPTQKEAAKALKAEGVKPSELEAQEPIFKAAVKPESDEKRPAKVEKKAKKVREAKRPAREAPDVPRGVQKSIDASAKAARASKRHAPPAKDDEPTDSLKLNEDHEEFVDTVMKKMADQET